MSKFLLILASIATILTTSHLKGSLQEHREAYGEILDSRFILNSDYTLERLADIPLRAEWWSRFHEYFWASQFTDLDAVVLDAACGVSHPFKWYLGQTCKETWALDADPRFGSIETILQETYDDLGDEAYDVLATHPELYESVNLVKGSICQLPENFSQFDRIFCISTIEHLSEKDRQDAMSEFARALAPDGLLVITVDYPEVKPQVLIDLAKSVGLVPAGNVFLDIPKDHLTNGQLSIFRCVFVHKHE